MTPLDLRAWRKRLGITRAAAAQLLGMSARGLAHYEDGDRPIPHVVDLACESLERRYQAYRDANERYPLPITGTKENP